MKYPKTILVVYEQVKRCRVQVTEMTEKMASFFESLKLANITCVEICVRSVKPCPAEPGYILPLQKV